MELESLGVNKGHKQKLASKGIGSVEDLLAFLPRKYNDFSHLTGFLPSDMESCIIIKIKSVTYYPARRYTSKGADLVMAMGYEKETGCAVSIQWFNQNWMYNQVSAMTTRDVFVAGKATYNAKFQNYTFVNPSVFTDQIASGMKVYPVYSKISGISNNWLISTLTAAESSTAAKEEIIPDDIAAKYGLNSMEETYRYLHNPKNMQEVQKGKNRILFNDLLDFSLRNEYAARQNCIGSQFNIRSLELYNNIQSGLPFTPTEDQKKAVDTIISMARAGKRINALVCGDVGTGKTYVAQMAAALFAGSGYQVAVLAPTQILAAQHYEDFSAMFEPFGVKVVLVNPNIKKKAEKKAMLDSISSGEASIVIGTHSIFSDSIHFKNLACAIADEEHKFGVCQRNSLIAKAADGVHTISMSATPIPRSLATVMYGDAVQLLSIETRPLGRLPIVTGIAKSREAIYKFLKAQISQGRQAYVVCPMIEKNEKLEGVKSVEEVYDEYMTAFKGTGIVIEKLTGQIPKDELTDIISRFKNDEVDILIATTVVEVGVNVPNASAVIIHNAERFGLAGLHQLRGRVGRGKYQSYCVLESDVKAGQARQRLEAMCRTNNGFKIAEYDLKIRGAGELLGTVQSGKNKYLGLALAYPQIYREAKEAASELLDRGISCCKATKKIMTDTLIEIEE